MLGGVSYEIEQLPMRPNKEFRDSLGAPVLQIADVIQNSADLELTAESLRGLVGIVKDVLLGSMDILLEALFRYAPALMADRERIEAEAYDDEAVAALGVCVQLAFPLDRALTGLISSGLPVTPTSTSLRSTNGGNGTKKPLAAHRQSTPRT